LHLKYRTAPEYERSSDPINFPFPLDILLGMGWLPIILWLPFFIGSNNFICLRLYWSAAG